jgi:DNA polymerase III epsilon subunit-like protein
MRAIILDVETSGLFPRGVRNVTMSNLDMFPYIVQFSYLVCNNEEISKISNHIIRLPGHVIMDNETVGIHKITNEESQKKGNDLKSVLLQFIKDLDGVNFVVGHNIDFDWTVIKAEFHRLCREYLNTDEYIKYWGYIDQMTLLTSKLYCTMKNSTKLCNILEKRADGSTYAKWPTLEQLHSHLFGIAPINMHNSLHDIIVTFRCFYMMRVKEDICDENPEMVILMKKALPVGSPLKIIRTTNELVQQSVAS